LPITDDRVKEVSAMSTILVVDDEVNLCKLYEKELQGAGYRVVVATSGKKALELVAQDGIDLVVLDIRMSGQDGIETLRQLVGQRRDLPVILHTAYAEYKLDFNTWMANAYVMKSSDLTELKDKIQELLP
jgi:CheY-like chemotaxis protein